MSERIPPEFGYPVRMRIFLMLALVAGPAIAETESFQAGTRASIGPDGVSVSVPGFSQGLNIKNEGNGVYSSSFSITGAISGAQSNTQTTRVLPPIVVPSSSGVLTDQGTFFKSVGGGAREIAQPKSRRPTSP
jgi:hypothetical protein